MVAARGSVRGSVDGKRRQQAAATQEQLLVAAREVFEQRGYRSATVGAITELANTAHGTFYLYFKNKEDVFGKVIAEVVRDLYDRALGPFISLPPERAAETTADSIGALLTVFDEHRGLWRSLLEAVLQSATIEQQWLDLRRTFTDRLIARLDELARAGVARPLDAEVAAHALVGMVEWFAFTGSVFAEPDPATIGIDRATAVLADLWNHAISSASAAADVGIA
ncbi:MAG: putative transcriptional regulator, TetR family protein [Acidimicrobiales bacterium]|nr:putative transcriptional regulator, TetR family protein [Acidimicrobiales bacterium]